MKRSIRENIEEIVNRETKAWDIQDVDLLLSIFHPDMVWPWPKTSRSHNPEEWIFELGRFDYERWRKFYVESFHSHRLIHNKRKIRKIVITKEGDGAFAVVDKDTLWINSEGQKELWKGRVCKVYSKGRKEWKLIMHTGVLEY